MSGVSKLILHSQAATLFLLMQLLYQQPKAMQEHSHIHDNSAKDINILFVIKYIDIHSPQHIYMHLKHIHHSYIHQNR